MRRLPACVLHHRRADLHGRSSAASRFCRAGGRARHRRRSSGAASSGASLIVGAGRTGRSLLRELRETPGERVVGFVDDDPQLRRRRDPRRQGRSAALDELGWVLGRAAAGRRARHDPRRPARAARRRRRGVRRAGVPCRFVRREIDLDPRVVLGAAPSERLATHAARRAEDAQPRRRAARRSTASSAAFPLLERLRPAVRSSTSSRRWKRVTPVAVHRRARVDAALALDRRDRPRRAARTSRTRSDSLYTYLIAPFWLIHNVGTAYAAIKYLDVFVMASVVFPTYFLARLVVGKYPALFAAAVRGASRRSRTRRTSSRRRSRIPYAALCFFLIAKALVENRAPTRRVRWGGRRRRGSVVAPAVRGELVVIPIVLAVRDRLFDDLVERLGTVAPDELVVGRLGRRDHARVRRGRSSSAASRATTTTSGTRSRTFYKHRIFMLGDWAAGRFAIGIGIIPLVAGLAALCSAPRARRRHVSCACSAASRSPPSSPSASTPG